jgi:hypothetical protein
MWLEKKKNFQNWSPKLMFLNEKKIKKIPAIFDFENQILSIFDIA